MNTKRNVILLGYPKIDHEKDYVYFWMPFSLLTVAQALREETSFEVVLFDGNQDALEGWEALLVGVADRLLFVGLSVMTGGGQIGHGLRMAEIARERVGVPIVFGGPHPNVLPEETAEHDLVDIVLTGPGQRSAPALALALAGETGLDSVPGLVRRTCSGYERGPANPPRTGALGGYPWHLLDVERYVRDDPTVGSRTLNYVSSQGCAYRCRFCYEMTYARKWSAQPAAALLSDVRSLVSSNSLNGIKFYDADWFINLRRAEAFIDGLLAGGPPISWAASINPRDVLRTRSRHPDLLKKAVASGCNRLLMGVESGSDRVLKDVIQKDITRAEIIDAASEIARCGIMSSCTFIVGFPGETDAEIEETYDLLARLRDLTPTPETRVHLFAPYPGTPLWNTALEFGFKPPRRLEEWSQFDYYDSQTPWTSPAMVARARLQTHMVLRPSAEVSL